MLFVSGRKKASAVQLNVVLGCKYSVRSVNLSHFQLIPNFPNLIRCAWRQSSSLVRELVERTLVGKQIKVRRQWSSAASEPAAALAAVLRDFPGGDYSAFWCFKWRKRVCYCEWCVRALEDELFVSAYKTGFASFGSSSSSSSSVPPVRL